MWSPKLIAEIPHGKALRQKLTYGEDNRSHEECLYFIEDVRHFRKTFKNAQGVPGQEFHDWKSEEHQRGLDQMTDAYLEVHGRGTMFWPNDPILPSYGSLRYSEDRSFIRKQVKLLFFRLNLSYYRNNKHKESKTKISEPKSSEPAEVIYVDSQESHSTTDQSMNYRYSTLESIGLSQQSGLAEGDITANDSRSPSFGSALKMPYANMGGFPSPDLERTPEDNTHPRPESREQPHQNVKPKPQHVFQRTTQKRQVAGGPSNDHEAKRSRLSPLSTTTSNSATSVRARPQRSTTRTTQPRYTMAEDYAFATKSPSLPADAPSTPQDSNCSYQRVERTHESGRSAPRLLVRLKAPRALLLGLDPRLNERQDTESKLSGTEGLRVQHETPELSTTKDSQGFEIRSTPLTVESEKGPEAAVDASYGDEVAATPAATNPATSQPRPSPPASHEPLPVHQKGPSVNVTCRFIYSREDGDQDLEWKPEGGFKRMSFLELAEKSMCENFAGAKMCLRLKGMSFRRVGTVKSGLKENEQFEDLKREFSEAILEHVLEEQPGQSFEYELEIEPIEGTKRGRQNAEASSGSKRHVELTELDW